MNLEAAMAGAKVGAILGLKVGSLPLIAGLLLKEYRKAIIGLAACIFAAALAGKHALAPVAVGALFTIFRAQKVRGDAQEANGLVFRYGPLFALVAVAGIPVAIWMAFYLLRLALTGIVTSGGGVRAGISELFLGSLGAAFGLLTVLAVKQWYVLVTEYTVTDDGVTEKSRSSSRFLAWSRLKSARYRSALRQIDLWFDGHERRVILTNTDLDPELTKLLSAVSLIEKVTGRPLQKTRFW